MGRRNHCAAARAEVDGARAVMIVGWGVGGWEGRVAGAWLCVTICITVTASAGRSSCELWVSVGRGGSPRWRSVVDVVVE